MIVIDTRAVESHHVDAADVSTKLRVLLAVWRSNSVWTSISDSTADRQARIHALTGLSHNRGMSPRIMSNLPRDQDGMSRTIRIATRRSRLALWQADHVADLLRAADGDVTVELVHVSTEGDRVQSEPLAGFGGMGVFTREVQRAVLDERADLAVHSLKDLPTEPADGLALAGVPERGPVRDVLVLPAGHEGSVDSLDDLPEGARIGTGSLRRRAQLLHCRPDLSVSDVRGNVETRLRKLDGGEYDALVLAEAGLRRLELAERISLVLGPPLLLHAVGQGALGLECRGDDEEIRARLAALSDAATFDAVLAERSLLNALRAGCHAPVGVATEVRENDLSLTGVVLAADGTERITVTETGESPEPLGRTVAERLLEIGAASLIAGG